MLQGFVTIGKAELVGAIVVFVLLGVALGSLVMIIARLVKAQPGGKHRAENRCPRGHLDVQADVDSWLRLRDYSLITNEILATLTTGPLSWPTNDADAPSRYLWHEDGNPVRG